MSNNIVSHGKRMVREDLIKKLLNGDFSVKLKDITNIQSLTDEQINELKAGDIVLKKTGDQTHTYIVTYKEENHGICISYFNAGYSETVSYDYTDGHWVYNSTDIVEEQPKLTAGDNIQINGNTISATDTTYTAGNGINITDGVISYSGSTSGVFEHNITLNLITGQTQKASLHFIIVNSYSEKYTRENYTILGNYLKQFAALKAKEVTGWCFDSNNENKIDAIGIYADDTYFHVQYDTGQFRDFSYSQSTILSLEDVIPTYN